MFTIISGNLFEIAAHRHGEAEHWIRFYEVNKLTDPWIVSTFPISLIFPAIAHDDVGLPSSAYSVPMVL